MSYTMFIVKHRSIPEPWGAGEHFFESNKNGPSIHSSLSFFTREHLEEKKHEEITHIRCRNCVVSGSEAKQREQY